MIRMPLLLCAATLLAPLLAIAHPVGNVSTNHWAGLVVGREAIAIDYVLDLAELPAFRERRRIDADGNGSVSPTEERTWADATVAAIAADLVLTLDGTRLPLERLDRSVTWGVGADGLPTLRLDARWRVDLPDAGGRVVFRDAYRTERPGWREIVARAEGDVVLADATVPATDASDRLRAHDDVARGAPLRVYEARFTLVPGPAAAAGDARP